MKRQLIPQNSKNNINILYQELNENKNVLGDSHPETIKSYQKLIQHLLSDGQKQSECLNYVQITLNLYEAELDRILNEKGHIKQQSRCLQVIKDYLDTTNIKLKILEVQGESLEVILEMIDKLLEYQKGVFSENSSQYILTLQKKARILLNNKDKLSSMSCLEQCLKIQSKILSQNHLAFAETYMMIGEILNEYGLFEGATKHYYLALNLYEGQSHVQSLNSAHVRVEIASLLYRQNKISESLHLLQKALTIYQTINFHSLSQNDYKIYSCGLYQYSVNLRDLGQLDKALQFANLDFQIKQQYQLDILDTYSNLGQIYYLKGEMDQSKYWFDLVLQYVKILYEKDPENTKHLKRYTQLLNQLLLISKILNQNTDAIKYQKSQQNILMRLNFKKAKKKSMSCQLSSPFQSNIKKLESFPSFASLSTKASLPSISNFFNEGVQSQLNDNKSKKQKLLTSHSLSNLNINENPTCTTLFNRSMSLMVKTKKPTSFLTNSNQKPLIQLNK